MIQVRRPQLVSEIIKYIYYNDPLTTYRYISNRYIHNVCTLYAHY